MKATTYPLPGTAPGTDLLFCGQCRRLLPATEFYFRKQRGRPDCYCKECRRRNNAYLRNTKWLEALPDKPSYPVITRTANRQERLALILHARQVVRERVLRKRNFFLLTRRQVNKATRAFLSEQGDELT